MNKNIKTSHIVPIISVHMYTNIKCTFYTRAHESKRGGDANVTCEPLLGPLCQPILYVIRVAGPLSEQPEDNFGTATSVPLFFFARLGWYFISLMMRMIPLDL